MLGNKATQALANQLLLAIFRWSADDAALALVSRSEQSSHKSLQKFPHNSPNIISPPLKTGHDEGTLPCVVDNFNLAGKEWTIILLILNLRKK